jgi:hypothetical protein
VMYEVSYFDGIRTISDINLFLADECSVPQFECTVATS